MTQNNFSSFGKESEFSSDTYIVSDDVWYQEYRAKVLNLTAKPYKYKKKKRSSNSKY